MDGTFKSLCIICLIPQHMVQLNGIHGKAPLSIHGNNRTPAKSADGMRTYQPTSNTFQSVRRLIVLLPWRRFVSPGVLRCPGEAGTLRVIACGEREGTEAHVQGQAATAVSGSHTPMADLAAFAAQTRSSRAPAWAFWRTAQDFLDIEVVSPHHRCVVEVMHFQF
jgi:hypothetical protein